jgi:FMN phosphatase YigB (HAD superfamily)
MPGIDKLVHWVSNIYSVGLMSNIMPGLIEKMIDRGIIPKVNYHAIIDSSQVHTIKPESKIYKIATEKATRPASQILLVDDSRANLMAANKFDWHVLWFDDYQPSESISHIKQSLELPSSQ